MISWAPVNQQYIYTCHDWLTSGPLAEFASVFPGSKRLLSPDLTQPEAQRRVCHSPRGHFITVRGECVWEYSDRQTCHLSLYLIMEGGNLLLELLLESSLRAQGLKRI